MRRFHAWVRVQSSWLKLKSKVFSEKFESWKTDSGTPSRRALKDTEHGKLSRSSIEAYIAIAIAILLAVFPMTWYLRLFLFVVLAVVCVDFCWRSPPTYNRNGLLKVMLCAIVVGVVMWTGVGNVMDAYKETRFPPHVAYMLQWGEAPEGNGCYFKIDGNQVKRYASQYRLWTGCYHPGLLDQKDAPVSGSVLIDIEPGIITIRSIWNEKYISEANDGARGTRYFVALVPKNISSPSFSTIRDATGRGVYRPRNYSGTSIKTVNTMLQ